MTAKRNECQSVFPNYGYVSFVSSGLESQTKTDLGSPIRNAAVKKADPNMTKQNETNLGR